MDTYYTTHRICFRSYYMISTGIDMMMTTAANAGLASNKAKHRQRRIKRAGQTKPC